MNKKILIFLTLSISLLFSTLLIAQRGMKRVRTSEGNEITLYKASYALVVGNGNYAAGWDPLPGAIRDVDDVADVLEKNGFMVTLLKNANKSTFLSYLGDFTYKYGQEENNQLLFYFAGHGYTVPLSSGEELGYIVMVDSPFPLKDPQGFDSKSVDMHYLITQCKKIISKHVLFMFDCCFSGTVLNVRNIVTPPAITDVVRYPVRQFITAGRGDEPVPDRSYFKELFLDLLEGRREEPNKDGYLTGEELGYFLKVNVPLYNETQHPQYGKIRDTKLDKGDFVFVLGEAKPAEEKIQLPPRPPETAGLDLTTIKKAEEERAKIEAQWQAWQVKMRSDFNELEKMERSTGLSSEQKKALWQKYLDTYNADNPISSEDEQLRQRVAQRIKELSKPEKKPVKELLPLPEKSGPIIIPKKVQKVLYEGAFSLKCRYDFNVQIIKHLYFPAGDNLYATFLFKVIDAQIDGSHVFLQFYKVRNDGLMELAQEVYAPSNIQKDTTSDKQIFYSIGYILDPGSYLAALAVASQNLDKIGTQYFEFSLPDFKARSFGLDTTPIFFVKNMEYLKSSEKRPTVHEGLFTYSIVKIEPKMDAFFSSGESITLFFYIFGSQPNTRGQWDIQVKYGVFKDGQKVIAFASARYDAPLINQQLPLVATYQREGSVEQRDLGPGDYKLLIEIKGNISGKFINKQIDFKVR